MTKKGLVVAALALLGTGLVAYAGDGPPDLEPSLMVPPELRFARGWLAEELRARHEPFRPFRRWSEIAETLG
jgi:2-hydroxy-3-keto-5-methylthiopentenyl-1-phosphate phosphatase